MRSIILLTFFLSGCINALAIKPPTFRVHAKGHDDNINGAAITIRVKWDYLK